MKKNKQVVRFLLAWILSFGSTRLPLGTAKLTEEIGAPQANFSLHYKDTVSSYKINGVFVLPGEALNLKVQTPQPNHVYTLHLFSEGWKNKGVSEWSWKAPKQAGLYPVQVLESETDESITLNIFVMIPYKNVKKGILNGYHIGSYPAVAFKRLPIYEPPPGFVEVTEENMNVLIAPHFRLRQFLCKQKGSFPKYVVLREKLLFKLEALYEKVNDNGYACNTLTIMSGYRTPSYNRAIQNVKYSRHLWGDAADIFVDENPKDGVMDDLNGDGKIDIRDSYILSGLVSELNEINQDLTGGIGDYRPGKYHGPFVHVDARGIPKRWQN